MSFIHFKLWSTCDLEQEKSQRRNKGYEQFKGTINARTNTIKDLKTQNEALKKQSNIISQRGDENRNQS